MGTADLPRFVVVIPARFASQRYPGKPLAELVGADGAAKSLIRRSWEAAVAASDAGSVWVATDNDRIADEVRGFGGQVAMTASHCRNGTERCADALNSIPDCPDIIVNFQGDAPLTPPLLVGHLVRTLLEDSSAAVATPAVRCDPRTYAHLAGDIAEGRVGGTTVVFNRQHNALYFSKRLLPHLPTDIASPADHIHMHLGLYAYRREALLRYASASPATLEQLEGLEQLRFLHEGEVVKLLAIAPVGWDCIELNNPSDVEPIEAVLRERGIA